MPEIKRYQLIPRTEHPAYSFGAEPITTAADDPAEVVRDLASRLDTLQNAKMPLVLTYENGALVLSTDTVDITPSLTIRAIADDAHHARELAKQVVAYVNGEQKRRADAEARTEAQRMVAAQREADAAAAHAKAVASSTPARSVVKRKKVRRAR